MELKPLFLRLPCSRLSLSYLHEVYFVGTRENTNLVLRSHIDILPALLFATILGFAFGQNLCLRLLDADCCSALSQREFLFLDTDVADVIHFPYVLSIDPAPLVFAHIVHRDKIAMSNNREGCQIDHLYVKLEVCSNTFVNNLLDSLELLIFYQCAETDPVAPFFLNSIVLVEIWVVKFFSCHAFMHNRSLFQTL